LIRSNGFGLAKAGGASGYIPAFSPAGAEPRAIACHGATLWGTSAGWAGSGAVGTVGAAAGWLKEANGLTAGAEAGGAALLPLVDTGLWKNGLLAPGFHSCGDLTGLAGAGADGLPKVNRGVGAETGPLTGGDAGAVGATLAGGVPKIAGRGGMASWIEEPNEGVDWPGRPMGAKGWVELVTAGEGANGFPASGWGCGVPNPAKPVWTVDGVGVSGFSDGCSAGGANGDG
jgi:hypothetical protein